MPANPSSANQSQELLRLASEKILQLKGNIIDVLAVNRPPDLQYAIHLSKVISKLSPLIGNMIEYSAVSFLNQDPAFKAGKWIRQDPGFPDTIFIGNVEPKPGIEIKTWFPLATEITARFKDSSLHFVNEQTNVAMIAWLPEMVLFGRPRVIDIWVDSAKAVTASRDAHYHNPPDYLIFEPEDTTKRTVNLQQTNTNGLKFQGTAEQFSAAEAIVKTWGPDGRKYSPTLEYQGKLKQLLNRFPYRLDTNFAKMDRIGHRSLEEFKTRVLQTVVSDQTIERWSKLLAQEEQVGFDHLLKQEAAAVSQVRVTS